jgi:hypothetical protein
MYHTFEGGGVRDVVLKACMSWPWLKDGDGEVYVIAGGLLMTTVREAWVLLVAMAWARKHHMAMETGATSWHDGPEVDQGAVDAVADRATSGWSLPRVLHRRPRSL